MINIVKRDTIRDFYGKILGFVETDKNGDQQVRDFYGKILGFYDKRLDVTRDFYGKILTKGNTVIGLIYQNNK